MQIDKALISKLEHLARLQLSEAEREQIQGDLNSILAMVEKLQELDTTGVEPLIYLNEQTGHLRPDEVGQQFSREAALRNAPGQDGTFFTVPKVIDL